MRRIYGGILLFIVLMGFIMINYEKSVSNVWFVLGFMVPVIFLSRLSTLCLSQPVQAVARTFMS